MWVATNVGMISLVQHFEKPGVLLMRARAREHLVALAGKGKEKLIEYTPERDYAWRIEVAKESVAELLFTLVMCIDYGNLKGSVKDDRLPLRYQREGEAAKRADGHVRDVVRGFAFDDDQVDDSRYEMEIEKVGSLGVGSRFRVHRRDGRVLTISRISKGPRDGFKRFWFEEGGSVVLNVSEEVEVF